MSEEAVSEGGTTDEHRRFPAIPKHVAPMITIGTSFLVRKGMIAAYTSFTGNPAPTVHSRGAPLVTKMAWAALMSSVVTLVEYAVLRVVHEELVGSEADQAVADGATGIDFGEPG